MPKWFTRLCSDTAGAMGKDSLVLAAAVVALAIAVGGAMSAGTFDAIAEGLTLSEPDAGCVRTDQSGATDLSDCHN